MPPPPPPPQQPPSRPTLHLSSSGIPPTTLLAILQEALLGLDAAIDALNARLSALRPEEGDGGLGEVEERGLGETEKEPGKMEEDRTELEGQMGGLRGDVSVFFPFWGFWGEGEGRGGEGGEVGEGCWGRGRGRLIRGLVDGVVGEAYGDGGGGGGGRRKEGMKGLRRGELGWDGGGDVVDKKR